MAPSEEVFMLGNHMLRNLALGAAAIYLFDPKDGPQRRTRLRNSVRNWFDQVGDDLSRSFPQRNRQRRHLHDGGDEADYVHDEHESDSIVRRVKSAISRTGRHSGAVEVMLDEGTIWLRGPVLSWEANDVIQAARSVAGVERIESQLELHDSPQGIAALEQAAPQVQSDGEWSMPTRVLVATGGTAMLLRGLFRRGLQGKACRWLGLGLLARSATNCPFGAMGRRVLENARGAGERLRWAHRPELTSGGEESNGELSREEHPQPAGA